MAGKAQAENQPHRWMFYTVDSFSQWPANFQHFLRQYAALEQPDVPSYVVEVAAQEIARGECILDFSVTAKSFHLSAAIRW